MISRQTLLHMICKCSKKKENYKLAFPLVSYGISITNPPTARYSTPLTYTGTADCKFAYIAIIGAMIPNTRFADAVNAFPVPRSFVRKISGVYAYSTAERMLLMKL